jgi:putative tryptophan/tyrosine transport system substrate-binding protein
MRNPSLRILALLIAAVGALVSATAFAQDAKKVWKVGILWHAANEQEEAPFLNALRDGFRDLGYIEGRTLILENTFAAEQYERFERNAVQLLSSKVDVLVATALPAVVAAQRVSKTLPIVFVAVPDPVGLNIVASLARPGGNTTGLTHIATDLTAKRIEIFKEMRPGASRLALLVNRTDPIVARRNIDEAQSAASRAHIVVHPIEVGGPEDFERAFATIDQAGVDGLLTGVDPMFTIERNRIAQWSLARGLPLMGHNGLVTKAGGLMSYAADYPTLFRRSAAYVDKILKGAKPSELPVEQPTRFQLIINLKTAKALGLNVPDKLLARADEVIE